MGKGSKQRPTIQDMNMSKYIVSLEEDPKTGELILPIPDELLIEMGWSEGE